MSLSTKMGLIRTDDITDNIIQSLMFNLINKLLKEIDNEAHLPWLFLLKFIDKDTDMR